MKKLFAILAMICMVAIAVPSMAMEIDEEGDQIQGGINIYLENGAFAAGDLSGSANIVAGQISFQAQENDVEINLCNKEEIYYQDYNDYYYNGGYDYYRGEAMTNGEYELKGQNQEWFQANRFSTGYGMAEMIQHGYQNGASLTAIQTPNLDLNGLDLPEMDSDEKPR